MKNFDHLLCTKRIKLRWFKNYYVSKQGKGYATRYYVVDVYEAIKTTNRPLYGPFIRSTAEDLAKDMSSQHYNLIFR